ncbi:hypothetical protein KUG47_03520 [Falsochrobactrum sp. TDYN1]|uniref:CoxF protein n=1 Tax=Falsochrobactrum tianjinense TaxID=2706015 RepID=A0A949PK60_9HYPH|nr:hypothetical protein [Falsochrobactrum sp. TDYN1]MBV2142567.1 hypothetical protein [Falsochrobactrum sp. TDYN1]
METVLKDKPEQESAKEGLDMIVPTESQKKAQRNRSFGLAIALVLFVLLVYVGTLAKMGANVFIRPM